MVLASSEAGKSSWVGQAFRTDSYVTSSFPSGNSANTLKLENATASVLACFPIWLIDPALLSGRKA
jgi:hypothetical protein